MQGKVQTSKKPIRLRPNYVQNWFDNENNRQIRKKGNWDARNETQLFGSRAIFCFLCCNKTLWKITKFPMTLMLKKHFKSCESFKCCLQYRNSFFVHIEWFVNFNIFSKNQLWTFYVFFIVHFLFYLCCFLNLIFWGLICSFSKLSSYLPRSFIFSFLN